MKYVKILAYSGALSGVGISLWANIRDAFIPEIPPGVDPELWRPNYPGYHVTHPGWFDIAIAVFFPLALGVAIELLIHVDWSAGVKDKVTRWGGVGAVGAIAGVVSYWHLRTALLLNGQNIWIASIGPLAVDGFAFMCIQVLLKLVEQERLMRAAPVVVPSPPMVLPTLPLANVPPVVPPASVPHSAPVSPWTTPPNGHVPSVAVPQDTGLSAPLVSTPGHVDNPQVTATVPPLLSPLAGGEDMGGQDLPESQDTDDVSTGSEGGRVPQDIPVVDDGPEGDTAEPDEGGQGLLPVDLERWELKLAGKTKPQIAEMHGVSPKTVQRSWQKVQAAHEKAQQEKESANA